MRLRRLRTRQSKPWLLVKVGLMIRYVYEVLESQDIIIVGVVESIPGSNYRNN